MNTSPFSPVALAEALLCQWEVTAIVRNHIAHLTNRALALGQLISLCQGLDTPFDENIVVNANDVCRMPHQAVSFTVYYASAQGSGQVAQLIHQLASSISKDSSYRPNRKAIKCSLNISYGSDEMDAEELFEIADVIFNTLLMDKNEISFNQHLANEVAPNNLKLCLLLSFFEKDSHGGMLGSKRYFSIHDLEATDTNDLALKLRKYSWSELQ